MSKALRSGAARRRASLRHTLADLGSSLALFLACGLLLGRCGAAPDPEQERCSQTPYLPNASACDHPWLGPCCQLDDPLQLARRQRQGDDSLLLHRILTDYPRSRSPSERPVATHPGTPLNISGGLTVFRIFGIDQRTQTFAIHYRVRLMWRDCRFQHNCSIQTVNHDHPSFKDMWRPQWKIDEEEDTRGEMKKGMIGFIPDGGVYMFEERVSRLRCSFDFKDMPFDRQQCSITVLMYQSSTINDTQAKLFSYAPDIELSVENIDNAEWQIGTQSQWTAEELTMTRELYNQQLPQSALRWSFPLERRSYSMVINFVFPAVLFYFVSWLGLWIDPGAVPARAAIGVIPVLIMTNKLSSLGNTIPPISKPFKLESFLIATLTFIILQMLEFGFVNYGLRRAKAAKERAPGEGEKISKVHPNETLEAVPAQGEALAPGATPSMRALPSAQGVKEGAARALSMPDQVATAMGSHMDMHFRWVSLISYLITALAILLG